VTLRDCAAQRFLNDVYTKPL